MSSADLPLPPACEAVTARAGAGRVVRASELDVATWRLPEPQRAALVSAGVPLVDDLVSAVAFHAEPTRYRLASSDDLDWVYGAAPGTGEVRAWSSDGSSGARPVAPLTAARGTAPIHGAAGLVVVP
ncbi:SUKH-4 family immunity protein [Micromonospora sp. NPDC050495]|uniref:SUKH-4 family immunity protein n=1 Tax=Micromonospora sp. NPDC050495 TaxID=3154936 RepID=UPI0034106486